MQNVSLKLKQITSPTQNYETEQIEKLMPVKWQSHIYSPLLQASDSAFANLILKQDLGTSIYLIFPTFTSLLNVLEEKTQGPMHLKMLRTKEGVAGCTSIYVAVGSIESQELFGTFCVDRLGKPL